MSNQYIIPDDIFERFWSRANVTNDENSCWNWKLSLNKDGYGQFTYKRKSYKAHRFIWTLLYGEIPKQMEICHTCDNPACVNPKHLFLGTHLDNIRDMVRKNRQSKGDAIRNRVKGELQGAHKLTKEQVDTIRDRYAQGGITYANLAKEYGVCTMQICRIVLYREWHD